MLSAFYRLAAACAAIAFVPLVFAQAPAKPGKDEFWEYKAWRSGAEMDNKKLQCFLSTGGDGDDSFGVTLERGGVNGLVSFREMLTRGGKPRFDKQDDMVLVIEGKPNKEYVDDFEVHHGRTADGIPESRVSMPSGYTPELIRLMRKADNVSVWRINPKSKKRDLIKRFSLDGFNANYLKISEWCKFHPDKLFQS